MDVEKAIETKIEPALRNAFGSSKSRTLLTTATLTYVTTVGPKVQRYRAFVDSICMDEQVIQEWGEAAAARQAKEWEELVPLEPETVVIVGAQAPG